MRDVLNIQRMPKEVETPSVTGLELTCTLREKDGHAQSKITFPVGKVSFTEVKDNRL